MESGSARAGSYRGVVAVGVAAVGAWALTSHRLMGYESGSWSVWPGLPIPVRPGVYGGPNRDGSARSLP